MKCFHNSVSVLLSLLTFCNSIGLSASASPVHVALCMREVDLTTQLVTEGMQLSFVGSSGGGDTDQVFVGVLEDQLPNLAYYDAHQIVPGEDPIPIGMVPVDASTVTGAEQPPENVVLFAIRLAHPIFDQHNTEGVDPTVVEIKLVYNGALTPLPSEIGQLEDQKMLLQHSLFALVPYMVQAQSMRINLPTKNVESYSKTDPTRFSERDRKITYGPYENISPFSIETFRVHFQTNVPFLVLTNVVREIQVSLWGQVTVEERVEFEHAGAKLKGSFSRVDYIQGTSMLGNPSMGGPASFSEITEQIPLNSHTLYFRDAIGNVSTSQYVHADHSILVQLGNRFPMFGGWKSSHIFGYSLPIQSVVSRTSKSGRLSFTMPFTPGIYAPIRNLEVRVVLPEGSAAIETNVPFEVHESSDIKKTYLDTIGRPVVVLRKSNAVPDHNVLFSWWFWSSIIFEIWISVKLQISLAEASKFF